MVGASADYVKQQDVTGVRILRPKESICDVCLRMELSRKQQNEFMRVLGKREEVFTDIPRKTSIIEHRMHVVHNRLIRCRLYALTYAVRGEIQEEIQEMINTGLT